MFKQHCRHCIGPGVPQRGDGSAGARAVRPALEPGGSGLGHAEQAPADGRAKACGQSNGELAGDRPRLSLPSHAFALPFHGRSSLRVPSATASSLRLVVLQMGLPRSISMRGNVIAVTVMERHAANVIVSHMREGFLSKRTERSRDKTRHAVHLCALVSRPWRAPCEEPPPQPPPPTAQPLMVSLPPMVPRPGGGLLPPLPNTNPTTMETPGELAHMLAALSPTPGELARLGQRSTSGRMMAPLPPGMILHPPMPSPPHHGMTPIAEVSPQHEGGSDEGSPEHSPPRSREDSSGSDVSVGAGARAEQERPQVGAGEQDASINASANTFFTKKIVGPSGP